MRSLLTAVVLTIFSTITKGQATIRASMGDHILYTYQDSYLSGWDGQKKYQWDGTNIIQVIGSTKLFSWDGTNLIGWDGHKKYQWDGKNIIGWDGLKKYQWDGTYITQVIDSRKLYTIKGDIPIPMIIFVVTQL